MDRFVFLIAMIGASPILLPMLIMALSKRVDRRSRLVLAWLSGIVFPAFLGWTIYRHEGGNGDPDPLAFFVSITVVAAMVSIATIMIVEARSVRE